MHEHKCDLPTSVQWISDLNDRLVGQVLSALKEIPSFGNPVFDQQVSAYVDGLGSWVRGHDSWSFEVNYTLYVFVDETVLIPTPDRVRDTSVKLVQRPRSIGWSTYYRRQ